MWFFATQQTPFMGNLIVQTCGFNSVCLGANPIGQPVTGTFAQGPGGSIPSVPGFELAPEEKTEDAYKSRSRRRWALVT